MGNKQRKRERKIEWICSNLISFPQQRGNIEQKKMLRSAPRILGEKKKE
jgi:hypothetical protein